MQLLRLFTALTMLALIFVFAGCNNPTGLSRPVKPAAVNIAAIGGVTPPVTGETPVTTITPNDQYTGTVAWNPSHAAFAASTQYTATITLTAKDGCTLQGVEANFFTVAGALMQSSNANSGVITAMFPATGGSSGGNKVNPAISSWPVAATITYGAALSSSALTGGSASVPGLFAWANGAAIPAVTNSGYPVTFTPSDTADYNTVTLNVYITVLRATLIVAADDFDIPSR